MMQLGRSSAKRRAVASDAPSLQIKRAPAVTVPKPAPATVAVPTGNQCLNNYQWFAGLSSSGHLQKDDNLVISLSTVPPRLLHPAFEETLTSLFSQQLKPGHVVLNVCRVYRRNFEYSEEAFYQKVLALQDRFPDLYVNWSPDYGPATKLLGLHHLPDILDVSSKTIIVVDDDMVYHHWLSYLHVHGMQLYTSDIVAVDEQRVNTWQPLSFESSPFLYQDQYCGFLYGWLSFAIRGCHLPAVHKMSTQLHAVHPSSVAHDDLVFTAVYRNLNLSAIELQLPGVATAVQQLDKMLALRTQMGNNTQSARRQLEARILQSQQIPYATDLTGRIHLQPILRKRLFPETIPPRYLLHNVANASFDPTQNNLGASHWHLCYLSHNRFMLTVTLWSRPQRAEQVFAFAIQGTKQQVSVPVPPTHVGRYTVIVHTNSRVVLTRELWPAEQLRVPLVQVWLEGEPAARNAPMSPRKIYSIQTLLCNLPYLPYQRYTDQTATTYIRNTFSSDFARQLLHTLHKVNVPAYAADLFRAIRGVRSPCLYIDCKAVLHTGGPILRELTNPSTTHALVQDRFRGICNGCFLLKTADQKFWKKYAGQLLCNLRFDFVGADPLAITGPQLLGRIAKGEEEHHHAQIHLPWQYAVGPKEHDWQHATIVAGDGATMMSTSYPGYYEENNYLHTRHYSSLFQKRNIYRVMSSTAPTYVHKVRGIHAIAYLNLKRSPDRDHKMRNLLKPLEQVCPHFRIEAVDGKAEAHWICRLPRAPPNPNPISDVELSCTLSHCKALTLLLRQPGSIFLVIEDDISFWPWEWVDVDLPTIIREAPENWQIIKLHKTAAMNLYDKSEEVPTYIPWENTNSSSGAYLITREGAEAIVRACAVDTNNRVTLSDRPLHVADDFLFRLCESHTYEYKYNLCEGSNEDSTIHQDHLPFHRSCTQLSFRFLLMDQLAAEKRDNSSIHDSESLVLTADPAREFLSW